MKNTIRARIPELLLALTTVSCWVAGTSHAVGLPHAHNRTRGRPIGLAATLPVLWIGVTLSTPAPTETAGETVRALGQPALLQAASTLVHGPLPDSYGLALHPLAVAAWIGILLTTLIAFCLTPAPLGPAH